MLFKKRRKLENRISKLERILPKMYSIMVDLKSDLQEKNVTTTSIEKETELTADDVIDEILNIREV